MLQQQRKARPLLFLAVSGGTNARAEWRSRMVGKSPDMALMQPSRPTFISVDDNGSRQILRFTVTARYNLKEGERRRFF